MPHDDLTIVYEDRSLLLCVKPVGVLSEDSENGASMPHLLRQHYAAAHQPDYIATVHRLDKVTGGLMLFSRQRAVTGRLIAAVAEHRVEKEYLAVLRGHPPDFGLSAWYMDSSRGLPLLGDIRYGSKDANCSTALWSYRLALIHPITGERIDVTQPPPEQYPWNLFNCDELRG